MFDAAIKSAGRSTWEAMAVTLWEHGLKTIYPVPSVGRPAGNSVTSGS